MQARQAQPTDIKQLSFGSDTKVADGTRGYRHNPRGGEHQNITRQAAERILERLDVDDRSALLEHIRDYRTSPAGEKMKNKMPLVERLRSIIASGLGRFDLLVIDEAHKARGANSSLSRVLGEMTWKAPDVFRLGLTATPVELDAQQWLDTLGRLDVPEETLAMLRPAIKGYVTQVDELRARVALTPETVDRYRAAAEHFQTMLSPFVMRRDQREDSFIQDFHRRHGSHRHLDPIETSLASMPLKWKRAFLASEAMSLLAEHSLTPAQRRQRLSLPDGRQMKQLEEDPIDASIDCTTRGQRAWAKLADEVTKNGGAELFSHPAITRAVTEIETLVAQGQKVLVFGRFTKPMRTLTYLLDAREMLRRVCAEEGSSMRWPASKLPANTYEREAALQAALDDPTINIAALDRADVEQRMVERAARYEAARRSNLAAIRSDIKNMAEDNANAALLSNAWKNGGSETGLLAALEDQRMPEARHVPWTGDAILEAFEALVREIRGHCDRGEGDDSPAAKAEPFPELLNAHLEDFNTREGHFARLMDGSTAPLTRRLLQASFNRQGSWPQVLVTQSTVGREGLNLQSACRVVVMLHLEWNPGNVEQQIGRVDRIGSRWRREAADHDVTGDNLIPRILIRPVLVRGTYADHQWSVLSRRWASLRAQLNGEVIAAGDIGEQNEDLMRLLKSVRDAAPNFSPPQHRPKEQPFQAQMASGPHT